MLYESTTTLNEIRVHSPCRAGWTKLLAHLGKTQADDEPLPLLTILENNGLDDALWCLRAASLDRLSRHFQAWCAEQVLHHFEDAHPGDARVRDQIEMLKNDSATSEQRDAARSAALDAADAALDAAAAARSAAYSAARDAAAGARDAWDATRAAAWSATRAAAQDAAYSAAYSAARDAAWSATRAATRDAARDAWDAQEAQLRKMIGGE